MWIRDFPSSCQARLLCVMLSLWNYVAFVRLFRFPGQAILGLLTGHFCFFTVSLKCEHLRQFKPYTSQQILWCVFWSENLCQFFAVNIRIWTNQWLTIIIIPNGKTHNQIDHILVNRRWHSILPDVRSFRGADCDTDHFMVVAKVRKRLAVSKQEAQKFDGERFNLRS